MFALGALVLALGWELAGRLCVFLAFAVPLAKGLRERSFGWLFDDRRLRRDTHPAAYWGLVAADAGFALLALWFVAEELRRAMG